eukprot:CAMPEP_0115833956 /NCGR_PEP_ID=MMETSP0287-20121206/3438_1 /TAXON_ID=412157 /ORGANISM="Chrysochromulina rotalis, Strain UIO044" /LENGTH=143 /DNA_ID=CAMNT_0003287383 /DNA_START=575 /DNA_END=1007 /DNA_ORIENTATION=+
MTLLIEAASNRTLAEHVCRVGLALAHVRPLTASRMVVLERKLARTARHWALLQHVIAVRCALSLSRPSLTSGLIRSGAMKMPPFLSSHAAEQTPHATGQATSITFLEVWHSPSAAHCLHSVSRSVQAVALQTLQLTGQCASMY